MAVSGERASCIVYMIVSYLILLAAIQTITCKTYYQDGDSKLQSSTNISCLYSEFKTITCTWSLKEYYKNDYNNLLDIEENVHIYYTFNDSTSQYCYRDRQVYLQCVCLQSGITKCSWSHKSSQASESLSLLVAVNDTVTSKLLSSSSGQFELLDIAHDSDTYLLNENSYIMLVNLVALCTLIALSVYMYVLCDSSGKTRLRRLTNIETKLKEGNANKRFSFDIEYPLSSLSVTNWELGNRIDVSRIELDYTNHTDTYSGEIRAIRMTRESIRSQNATLINNVRKLLDENILPTNKDIQTINKCFGRQSQKIKTLCEQICGVIKRKMYEDTATDIWPAWNPKSYQIVFVVESTTITTISSTFHQTDLEIIEYKGNCSAFGKESHMVMAKEKELLTTQTYDDIGRLQSLQKKVSTYSKELMDKHKNITAIFPSIVKSVGYLNSGKHRFIETLCISIRVEKKVSGLIPLEEKPIATYLGKFPTDVIAGDFCFLGDRPNDFHENLKIGSAIHAGLETDKGEMLGGTMGCFVKHKIFGMCCLTSAHIVLSQAEIQEVLKDGYHEYDRNSLKPVFQPISKTLSQFGQVVAAACNEGQSETPGVEVALIQILCRQPTSGSFPLTDSKTKHTFAFNSGNIADAKLVRPLTEVYKFGIETGPTFGLLGIPGVSVRYRGGLRLENQLVVMPKKDAVFAKNGDSGSLAFIGISCPGTEAAIGLVSGGFDSGQVLVTPIHAALIAVQCPPYLHRFEDADSGFNDDISEGCENMDCS